MIKIDSIDGGKGFDWGKTSEDYAKYRDIYPPEFYDKLYDIGIGLQGQQVLDLGTGTGVIPRNMQKYSASFVGVDISDKQIEQAEFLTKDKGLDIQYRVGSAMDIDFDKESFNAAIACQCFWYFDENALVPKIHSLLKPNGLFAVLTMSWLPFEDKIAGKSEELVKKYSPDWTGAGFQRYELTTPNWKQNYFDVKELISFDTYIPFTKQSWNGRMKACRGIAASLTQKETQSFEIEHKALLETIAPDVFNILHFATMIILKKK